MSISRHAQKPSAGNLRCLIEFIKKYSTPDGQGGSSTVFALVGIAWAAPGKLKAPAATEKYQSGQDQHSLILPMSLRADQAFPLPASTECLDWAVRYNGDYYKLATIEPHDERSDYVTVKLIKNGVTIPKVRVLYNGAYTHNGSQVY